MLKTTELLDKLKAAYNLPSDYAAAKKLGITTQTVSGYRCKRSFFEDRVAVNVAELLDIEPLQKCEGFCFSSKIIKFHCHYGI